MRRALLLSLLLCVAAAVPVGALTPYLVKDLNPVPVPASSSPQGFVRLGAQTLFLAKDANGTRVWRSDGTAAGTVPLPGCEACEGDAVGLYAVGVRAFFVLRSPSFEYALWSTAGTRRSTRRLLSSLAAPIRITASLPERGIFVFAALDAQNIPQLWRSDGTTAGTYQLTQKTSHYDSEPQSFLPSALASNTLFFEFPSDPEAGEALWKTDGTVAGTQEVRSFEVGGDAPSSLREVGGAVTFVAGDDTVGMALWRSDGTAEGTVPLLVSRIESVHAGGGKLYFVGFDGNGAQLGVSDGTPAGTRLVTRFAVPSAFGPVDQLFPAVAGSRVFFPADDGVHGLELWTSDGTPGGTHMVGDLCPGACSSGALPLSTLPDGRLLVSATDGSRVGLWTTLGGFSDFVQVKDFCAAGACGRASWLADLGGGRALLSADDGVHGYEPWVSDGTAAGTSLVADLCLGACGSSLLPAGTAGSHLLFTMSASTTVSVLVGTDGTPAGTAVLATLADLSPTRLPAPRAADHTAGGSGGALLAPAGASAPDTTVDLSGIALFAGTDRTHGLELWRTDGTPAGTSLVADVDPRSTGVPSSFPTFLRAAGARLFLFADDGVVGNRLWTSDGTAAGTVPVEPPFLGDFENGPAAALGDTLYFGAEDPVSGGLALFRSDGRPNGTLRLTPQEPWVQMTSVLAVSKTVYFAAGAGAYDLWKTDGTPEGTVPVGAPPISLPGAMKAFAGRLLYFDYDELWSTDGTAAGTFQIAQLVGRGLAERDGRVYFVAGGGLFATDGTIEGTHAVVALGPLRSADYLTMAGRTFYVFAERTDGTPVLIATDGTAAGTKRIPRVARTSDYDEEPPVDLGGRLFFRGSTQAYSSSGSLWVSDGTAAGTKPLLDSAGRTIVDPTTLRVFSGSLVFATGGDAVRLWQSDGTPAGTRPLLTFLSPTPDTGRDLTIAGDRLYFSRTTKASGAELWALRP